MSRCIDVSQTSCHRPSERIDAYSRKQRSRRYSSFECQFRTGSQDRLWSEYSIRRFLHCHAHQEALYVTHSSFQLRYLSLTLAARTDVWESGSVDERAVYLLCGNADFQVSPWRGQYEFRSELILIHRFAARRTLVVNRSQNQNSPRTENFDRDENPPSTMASFLQEEDG